MRQPVATERLYHDLAKFGQEHGLSQEARIELERLVEGLIERYTAPWWKFW